MSSRFPRDVYGDGADPNAQLSLANERTFLAWVRTALALLAASVAVHAPGLELDLWARTVASLWLLLAAAVALGQSWWRWRATERALRAGQPLPGFGGAAVLTVALLGILVVGVAVSVVVIALR